MNPRDLDHVLLQKIRSAYERARLRHALIKGWPGLLFVVAIAIEAPEAFRLLVALAIYATVALAIYIGGSAGRAARLSAWAAWIPFLIVRLAESRTHSCLGGACVSWCLPACVLGGSSAGGLVGWLGRKADDPFAYLIASVGILFLGGSLGCECAGLSGLIGIAGGALLGASTPFLVHKRFEAP
ncbi:MAG: hypothetical protein N2515_03390 [Deltaproteobacteria bacterium]|nr:hypothetical protein [Deltaproteobacteria bacterium]